MRFTDKIKYQGFTNEWTNHPQFEFMAPIVASESDVIAAVLRETFMGEDEIYVERLGTSAIKPDFHVYRIGYSGVVFYIRSEKTP